MGDFISLTIDLVNAIKREKDRRTVTYISALISRTTYSAFKRREKREIKTGDKREGQKYFWKATDKPSDVS